MDEIQKHGILSTEGIYRAAFPAFRVFIYGREVSGDVIDVRVNHAGGSQDRSPGTCSFTLVNKNDKYILDHADMVAVGNSRMALLSYLDNNVKKFQDSGVQILSSSGLDSTVLSSFLDQYAGEVAPFAGVLNGIDFLYEQLTKSGKYYEQGWEEGQVPDRIKFNVLMVKALKLSARKDKVWTQEQLNSIDPFQTGDFKANSLKYIYAFQEGDCIFHPNDPIRIAFRDPFDPTLWYWMFAGFMDAATEDVGVNQESVLTITGTDVSKMLRYSYLQLYSTLDTETIGSLFPDVPGLPETSSSLAFSFTEEIFAGVTIHEVLEFLFFGLASFTAAVISTTADFVSEISPEQARLYLLQNTGMSPVELDKLSPSALRKAVSDFRSAVLTKFSSSAVPPVCTPQGVGFKRKDGSYGVHSYFVGDQLSPLDHYGELITPANLRNLNDLLHHRVRSSDLQDMILPDTTASSAPLTSEQIITEIGTKPDTYPVGGGRVFYVSPATLGGNIDKGVLDRSATGSASPHSDFKDRLSFLYDLAEVIDFCCYATPKGDMVFEMPFFDFDAWMFDYAERRPNNAGVQSNIERSLSRLQGIEQRESSSGYTPDQIIDMMDLSSEVSLQSAGFNLTDTSSEFRYVDHFTIQKHETLSYSNSLNDHGMLTAYRSMKNPFQNLGGGDPGAKTYSYVVAPELGPILGLRIADSDPWGFTDTVEATRMWAALNLKKANAEARNLGIQTLPKFGLMVNRPLYWKARNYQANIVNAQHSISWFSDCSSTVNLNRARGWTGSMNSDKQEIFQHFNSSVSPFNLSQIVSKKKGGG